MFGDSQPPGKTFTNIYGIFMIHEITKTHSRIATIIVAFDAGSRNEKRSRHNLGIAHMLEHSIFKGTQDMNAMEIQKKIAFLGGRSNAFTSHEMVAYYITVPYENIEVCMEILSNMVFNPIFPEDEILREIEVVKEEEMSSKDDTESYIWRSFSGKFFGDHYLGTPVIGTQETIAKFTRDEIAKFHSRFCNRKDAIVSLCSNLTKKESKALLTKYFGKASGRTKTHYKFDDPSYPESSEMNIVRPGIEHTYVWMGMPSITKGSHLSPAVKLLTTILGSGMDSRLFEEVREKRGLVYGVSASSTEWQRGGLSLVEFSTRDSNVKEGIEVVSAEIQKIKTTPVTDEEIQRAKNKIKASFYSAIEDSYSLASWSIRKRLTGIPEIDDYMKMIDGVTSEDILEAAEAIYDTERLLTCICRSE